MTRLVCMSEIDHRNKFNKINSKTHMTTQSIFVIFLMNIFLTQIIKTKLFSC